MVGTLFLTFFIVIHVLTLLYGSKYNWILLLNRILLFSILAYLIHSSELSALIIILLLLCILSILVDLLTYDSIFLIRMSVGLFTLAAVLMAFSLEFIAEPFSILSFILLLLGFVKNVIKFNPGGENV